MFAHSPGESRHDALALIGGPKGNWIMTSEIEVVKGLEKICKK